MDNSDVTHSNNVLDSEINPIYKPTNKYFWRGFYSGLSILFISGFGDKIFFLNMIYASMNPFCISFWTILSICELVNLMNLSLGQLLKYIISETVIHWIAIIIFLILGICLIIKGISLDDKKIEDRFIEEKERNYLISQRNQINSSNSNDQENIPLNRRYQSNSAPESEIGVFDSWWKYLITYIFASIGDRSQLATIIITSKYDYLGVLTGTIVAVLLLVLVAMVLGKTVAKFLTIKQISIICGVMFILFAIKFFIDKEVKHIISIDK